MAELKPQRVGVWMVGKTGYKETTQVTPPLCIIFYCTLIFPVTKPTGKFQALEKDVGKGLLV